MLLEREQEPLVEKRAELVRVDSVKSDDAML
jgi:hypothetical protein